MGPGVPDERAIDRLVENSLPGSREDSFMMSKMLENPRQAGFRRP
jgi:hypothetical protein